MSPRSQICKQAEQQAGNRERNASEKGVAGGVFDDSQSGFCDEPQSDGERRHTAVHQKSDKRVKQEETVILEQYKYRQWDSSVMYCRFTGPRLPRH